MTCACQTAVVVGKLREEREQTSQVVRKVDELVELDEIKLGCRTAALKHQLMTLKGDRRGGNESGVWWPIVITLPRPSTVRQGRRAGGSDRAARVQECREGLTSKMI